MRFALPLAVPILLAGASPALAQGPSFDCRRAATADEMAICANPRLSELDAVMAFAYGQAQRTRPQEATPIAREGLMARRRCGPDPACILDSQLALMSRYQQLGVQVALPHWVPGFQAELSRPAAPPEGAFPDAPGEEPDIPEMAEPDIASPGAVDPDVVYPDDGIEAKAPATADAALPQTIGQCVNTTISGITDRFGEDVRANPESGSAVTFANGGTQVSYDKVDTLLESAVGDPVLMCLVALPQDCPPGDDRGKVYTTTNLRTQRSWSLSDSQHSCGGA